MVGKNPIKRRKDNALNRKFSMTPADYPDHPALRAAREAVAAFNPPEEYRRALLDLSYIAKMSQRHLAPLRARLEEVFEIEAGVLEKLKARKVREMKTGKTAEMKKTEAAIGTQTNVASFFEEALNLIENAEKKAYEDAADYALGRMERTDGYLRPEQVRAAFREVKILHLRAGLEKRPRSERHAANKRMKLAIREAYRRSEETARKTLRSMDAPFVAIEDIETAARLVIAHAAATRTLSKAKMSEKKREIEKDMYEAAWRCFQSSIKTYKNAPYFWEATKEAREKEMRRIGSYVLMASHTENSPSISALYETIRAADRISRKNAAEALAERQKEAAKERHITANAKRPVFSPAAAPIPACERA